MNIGSSKSYLEAKKSKKSKKSKRKGPYNLDMREGVDLDDMEDRIAQDQYQQGFSGSGAMIIKKRKFKGLETTRGEDFSRSGEELDADEYYKKKRRR